MLQSNVTAPLDIPMVDEQGTVRTLREFLGSWVVVYFYPRDNTPGCTVEAEGFRDMQDEYTARNVQVLGVSKDSCASHQSFIAKKKLTYTLIADTEHTLMDAFGTWGERKFMGRTYMGTSRTTFLIDQTGVIRHVWEKVSPIGHAKDVLHVLQSLS
jgi:thioredoxin-dependent peroxiredoxin